MAATSDTVIRPTPMQRALLPGTLIILAAVGIGFTAGKGSVVNLFVGLAIGGVVLLALSGRNYLELTDDGLRIQGPYGSGLLAWSDIEGIEVDEVLGGDGLTVNCYGKFTRLSVPRRGKALWADPDFDAKAEAVIGAWRAGKGNAGGKGGTAPGAKSPKQSGRVTPKGKRTD